jgi:hypothetical protein
LCHCDQGCDRGKIAGSRADEKQVAAPHRRDCHVARYMGVEAMGEMLNPPHTNETLQFPPKAA